MQRLTFSLFDNATSLTAREIFSEAFDFASSSKADIVNTTRGCSILSPHHSRGSPKYAYEPSIHPYYFVSLSSAASLPCLILRQTDLESVPDGVSLTEYPCKPYNIPTNSKGHLLS